MSDPPIKLVDDGVGQVVAVPLTPEEIAQMEADAAVGRTRMATAAFEAQADEERLGIINERAADDPAFAALAEFVLRGRQA